MIVVDVLLCVNVAGRTLGVKGVDMTSAASLIAIDLNGVQGRGARTTGSIVGGRTKSLYAGGRDVEEPLQEAEPTSKVIKRNGRKVLDPVRRHAATVGRAAAMKRSDDGRVVRLAVRPARRDVPFPDGRCGDRESIELSGALLVMFGRPMSWSRELHAHG